MTPERNSALTAAEKRSHDRSGSYIPRLLSRALFRRQLALTAVALALFAFFSVFAEHFFTLANIYDIARLSTFLLIVGVALTYVFIAGELDLSVGSLYGFAAVCMGVAVVTFGLDPWVAGLVAVCIGAALGAINGAIVTVIGVPSFIVTLGMFSLLRGAALVITAGMPIIYDDIESSFFSATAGTIGEFPIQVLWALGVLLLGAFVLKFTRFGAHVYATGGNPRAARAMGVSTKRVKFMCFVATGASCGTIAALQGGWLKEGSPTTGIGFELQVIAAVIIGGVALTGGEGSVYGTFIGAAIIGMLANGVVLLGVQGNWVQLFVGLIIVAVATLEVAVKRPGNIGKVFNVKRRGGRLRRSAVDEGASQLIKEVQG